MTEVQRIREEIMALESVVPTDGIAKYNDRQLQIAVLRHRLAQATTITQQRESPTYVYICTPSYSSVRHP